MRIAVFVFMILAVAVAVAERQPYERYKTVVDRQMFGAPPAGFDPTKMPSEVAKVKSKDEQALAQQQEQVKKAIKFSVLNVTPAGEVEVGFSDSADPKNPMHYFLKVGETTENGIWTVKEADAESATMTISNKEGIEVTLKLGGDSASNAGAVSRANAPDPRKGGSGGLSLIGGGRSMRERRRQREEQIRADEAAKHAAENAKREAAEKERAAREAEREAEREEQRKQLLQIQEELRKRREADNAAKETKSEDESSAN